MLNRIRIGENTDEDINVLRAKVRGKDHPDLNGSLYIERRMVLKNP